MTVVNHNFEDIGNFQVEYFNDIPYEDLKCIVKGLSAKRIGSDLSAEILKRIGSGLSAKRIGSDLSAEILKRIGSGSSATVYAYKHYAVKKLRDDYNFGTSRDNDVEVLKDLGHLDCIPTLYAVLNDNVLIMQLVNGVTVNDFCEERIDNKNITVDDKFVDKWDDALLSIIANGYSPNDLHEHNVMIEEHTSNPIIVDTGWFYKHGNNYDTNDKDSLRSDKSYGRANQWAGRVIRNYVERERDVMDCYVGF